MNERTHKIGYLLQKYPSVSEQFIEREIRALRKCGLDIQVFALAPADGLPRDPGTIYYSNLDLVRNILTIALFCLIRRRACLALFRELRTACGILRAAAIMARALYLTGKLNRHGIKHLHAHFLTMPAALAHAVATLTSTSTSLSAHAKDIFAPAYPQSSSWFRRTGRIFLCSDHALQAFKSKFPDVDRSLPSLARHGLEPEEYQGQTHGAGAGLIACGRLVPKKGFIHLLAAMRLLKYRGQAPSLTIYGEGPDAGALHNYIRRHKLGALVEIKPFVTHQELKVRLASAAALVQPSVRSADGDVDGIPNIILEAMAAGTPVIAGNVPAITECFAHGSELLLVDPENHDDLADAMEKLLDNQKLAAALSAAARQKVKSDFTLSANIRPLAGFLAEKAGRRTVVLEGLEATTGGTRKHMRLLLDNLSTATFEIHLACSTLRTPDFADDIAHFTASGISVHVINMKRQLSPLSDLRAIRMFAELLLTIRPDVLHFHSSKAGLAGRVAAYLCGYRNIVYSPHAFAFQGYSSFIPNRIFLLTERLLGSITRTLIAVSESEKEEAVRGAIMRPASIVVAPNALPADVPRVARERQPGPVTIGFLGRLERQKGCEIFIRACSELLKSHPSVKIRISGSGSLLASLQKTAGDTRIEFAGPTADASAFLAGIDLLVIPSLWEGNSYTLWEAVRQRTPFIVSGIPVHREILGKSSTCIFKRNDASALCSKLKLFLANPGSIAAAIDFEALEERYTFTRQMETVAGVYLHEAS